VYFSDVKSKSRVEWFESTESVHMGSVPDVEKQRFANLMSSGTSILLRRVTQVETVGANDRVTPSQK
jgi:hypothetical protein